MSFCSVLTAIAAETQGIVAAEGGSSASGRGLLLFNYDNCDYNGNCGNYWSGGRIAGVVIGCVAFVCGVIFLILALLMRRRRMARYQVILPCPALLPGSGAWQLLCALPTTAPSEMSGLLDQPGHYGIVVTLTPSAAAADKQPWCLSSGTSNGSVPQPRSAGSQWDVPSSQHLPKPGIPSKYKWVRPSPRVPSHRPADKWIQWSSDASLAPREARLREAGLCDFSVN